MNEKEAESPWVRTQLHDPKFIPLLFLLVFSKGIYTILVGDWSLGKEK